MIPAKEFIRLMEIGRKFERNEPLNAEDMAANRRWPNFHKPIPVAPCGCGCGQPMPNPTEQYKIDGKFVRADCWYDGMGDAIEQHPIISPNLLRRRLRLPH